MCEWYVGDGGVDVLSIAKQRYPDAFLKLGGLHHVGFSDYARQDSMIINDVSKDNTYKLLGYDLLGVACGRLMTVESAPPMSFHHVKMRVIVVVSDMLPTDIWHWRHFKPLGKEIERRFTVQRFFSVLPSVKLTFVDEGLLFETDGTRKRRRLK